MKIRITVHHWIYLVLFIIALSMIILGLKLFLMKYDKNNDDNIINLSEIIYNIFSTTISIISFLFGAMWASSRKSWTMQDFAEDLQSQKSCKHVIYLANEQIEFLKKKGRE